MFITLEKARRLLHRFTLIDGKKIKEVNYYDYSFAVNKYCFYNIDTFFLYKNILIIGKIYPDKISLINIIQIAK